MTEGPDTNPRTGRERVSGRRGTTLLAAAAAVVLVAVSVLLGVWLIQLDAERDRLAERAQVMSQVLERITEPGAASAALVNDEGKLQAVLILSDRTALFPLDLPAIDAASQSYVFWGVGANGPVALDTFDVYSERSTVKILDVNAAKLTFSTFAISLEPGGGLPAEPSELIATGQIER